MQPPRKPQASSSSSVSRLRQALDGKGEVIAPEDWEEPVLAPPVRVVTSQWLKEIQYAAQLADVGVKPRRSALFYGAPGTGKTSLAHHLAARLGIPMVKVGAESLINKYLGESAKNVAAIFNAVRDAGTNCVLFLDEIDAIGMDRESAGMHAEHIAMITVLLRKVEEFDGLLIGATNKHRNLDEALHRRFHIHLEIGLPGPEETWAIIKRYSQPFDMADEAIDLLAELARGASPALLRGLMEGMKRALVLNPLMRLTTHDPAKVFQPIVASVTPPPGTIMPVLWENKSALLELRNMPWPPVLPASDENKEAA